LSVAPVALRRAAQQQQQQPLLFTVSHVAPPDEWDGQREAVPHRLPAFRQDVTRRPVAGLTASQT